MTLATHDSVLQTMFALSPVPLVDNTSSFHIVYPYILVRLLPLPRFQPAQPVALDGPFSFGLPAPDAPAAPSPIFGPSSASHGMFQQPHAKHPFGPAQMMHVGFLNPDEMAVMNMPFPNNPAPMDFSNNLEGGWPWNSWNSELPGSNNVPGINPTCSPNVAAYSPNVAAHSPNVAAYSPNVAAHSPNVAFEMGSMQPSASTAFDPSSNQFDPQASSFLEQLASNELLEKSAHEPVGFAPVSAPASPLLHSTPRPIAPLPRSRVATTAPSTPRVSSSHLTPGARSSTPTTAGAPTQFGQNPSPSFPLLANDRAHAFTRSYSAPFDTPVRRSSLCHGSSHTLSRPATPAVPGPNDNSFDPPPSPFANESPFGADKTMAPLSNEQEDSHAAAPAPDLTANQPSAPLHMSKRGRAILPPAHAPTLKEIHIFKTREYSRIQKKRKSGPPSKKEKLPRVGTHMGLFSEQHQEYMFVFRSSLTADVVMLSPWLVPEPDMVERAIARSDAVTGLSREDVVQGKFEATASRFAMRGLSTCRSQFCEPILQLVKSMFKVTDKASAQPLLFGERFMYPTDAKNARDFADTPIMREATCELFFSHLFKLGAVYMGEMLQADSLETRKNLLTLAASAAGEPVPSSFDYTDMSPEALCGPPLASIAFAGITILHGLKKVAGTAGNFDGANYSETWGRYVGSLASHPRLGAIRAALFEEMKIRYSSAYCQGVRYSTAREPRAWVWKK